MTDLPLRDDLVGQVPYGAPQLDVAVQLNVNENPYPPSAALVADLAQAVGDVAQRLNRYPDREALALRTDLAGYLAEREGVRLDPSRVWAANGSNEVMLQLMQAFGGPGRTALGFSPTYAMYPDYCRDTFTTWVTEPREPDFSIDTDKAVAAVRRVKPTVTILTSPNNPTGTALPLDTARAVLDAAGEHRGLVVVDEAYGEFRRPGTPTALALLDTEPRLVVTRTMSKAFAFAGTRLGYCATSSQIVDALRLVRLPYHLSAVTQVVARTAIAHSAELLAQVDVLRDDRDQLVRWLREQGLEVADSDANFVFFGRFDDRDAVWQALLDRGVLVRATGPAGWLRVSIGTPDELAAFRDALQPVLAG
ncbi:histidinol-phosphate transaminase [Acidothermaceae bacterium B102]|nr:histidinol-phosphate transaminase [Acidothermaceae bacterium B102]